MKKNLSLLLLFISLNCFSQTFGKYEIENYKVYNNNTLFESDVWYSSEDKNFCFKLFNKTPIGIKKLIEETEYILLKNSIDFNSTFIDKTFLSSVVKDIKDYEMLNISISQDSSIVEKQWRISPSTYLTIYISKDNYKIYY